MAEVRFTLKGEINEVMFSPVADDNSIVLYGKATDGKERRIPLSIDNGILSLKESNPFEESDEIVRERLLGLAQEWLDAKSSGIENDIEEDPYKITKPGYSPDEIFVENKPFSIPQLIQFINEGDIEISPNFQRHFVWDKTRQSRLIESIFLGLPLPSIYFSQYKDGRLSIVDGLQRLNTIKDFSDNKLRLSNLEYLVECNGHTYTELEGILSPLRMRRFKQTQIMGFVIDYRSPSALKFDLFKRLNTGGKPLNSQEIRNCLSRPHLQKALQEMATCQEFVDATDKSVNDTRMAAQELVLRFMYFYDKYTDSNPIGEYSGRIDDELDNYIDYLNDLDNYNLYIDEFKLALTSSSRIFGEYAFRKIAPGFRESRRTPINKLLFTTTTVLLACHKSDYANRIAKISDDDWSVADQLALLIQQDNKLFSALTWSTNAKENFATVYPAMRQLFNQHLPQI